MNFILASPDESEVEENELVDNNEIESNSVILEVESDERYIDVLNDIHRRMFPEKKLENVKDFKCDQYAIFDWEAIYSSKKFRFFLFTYLLFIFSSMALAWSSCLYDEVENRPVITVIASGYLLLSVCIRSGVFSLLGYSSSLLTLFFYKEFFLSFHCSSFNSRRNWSHKKC